MFGTEKARVDTSLSLSRTGGAATTPPDLSSCSAAETLSGTSEEEVGEAGESTGAGAEGRMREGGRREGRLKRSKQRYMFERHLSDGCAAESHTVSNATHPSSSSSLGGL